MSSEDLTEDTDDAVLRDALGMAERAPAIALAPGQVIDDAFRIERQLGAGGMGVVYLARDLRLHRHVAIKVHRASAGEPGGERLMREAAALAQLVHPHVVTVHEVGTWAGHPYVAMEYVPGGTARTWLAAAPRAPRDVIAMFTVAGRGLAAAHAAGLVHRDFKPDNVLIGDDGRVRVADFGLARGFDDASIGAPAEDLPVSTLTATGAAVGTPAYMAPEQRTRGAKVGPAADQFAFAVAVWEALSGERPFAGETDAQLAAAIAGREVRTPPPRRMPAHVHRALLRALDADPAARFPSMEALIAELARDPSAGRARLAWIGGAAIAVVGVTAVLLARDDAPAAATCERAGDRVQDAWTPARRAELERAFAATGRGHAAASAAQVGDRLDAYAAAWSAARIDACEARRGGEQSASLVDLRVHCLDARRAELDALVAVLTAAPDAAVIDRALDATLALGELGDCADVPRLSGVMPWPSDPATSAALTAVQVDIAHARIAHNAGRFAVGLPIATRALAAAEPLGYPPVTAQARMWLGYLQADTGDPAAARASLDAATRDAAEAHDDELTAEIWMAVLYLVSSKLSELTEAERLLPYVEAAVVRAGAGPRIEGALERTRGMMRARQGRRAEAAIHLESARVLLERAYGASDPRVAQVLVVQSGVMRDTGDLDGARTAIQAALKLLEAAYGTEHPRVAATRNNLATILIVARDFEGARAALMDVIATKERLLGKDHPELMSSLVNLAEAYAGLDRPAEGLPVLARATEIAEAKYGPEHPSIGRILSVQGDVEAALGDRRAARASYDRALTLLVPALGADNPEVTAIHDAITKLGKPAVSPR